MGFLLFIIKGYWPFACGIFCCLLLKVTDLLHVGFSYMGFLLFIIKGYWPFVCGIFIYGFLLLSIKGCWPNFQYLMIFLVCWLGRREPFTFRFPDSADENLSHFWFADSAGWNLVTFLICWLSRQEPCLISGYNWGDIFIFDVYWILEEYSTIYNV
jgi:hypothetical protein